MSVDLAAQEKETLLRLLPPKSKLRPEVERRERAYRGAGCAACSHLGYVGRVGIFEVLVVDDAIRARIIARAAASDVKEISIANGMTTMLEDGVSKVFQGVTTVEELLRAAKE